MIMLYHPYGLFYLKMLKFILNIKQIVCQFTFIILWRKSLRYVTTTQGLFLVKPALSSLNSYFWFKDHLTVDLCGPPSSDFGVFRRHKYAYHIPFQLFFSFLKVLMMMCKSSQPGSTVEWMILKAKIVP